MGTMTQTITKWKSGKTKDIKSVLTLSTKDISDLTKSGSGICLACGTVQEQVDECTENGKCKLCKRFKVEGMKFIHQKTGASFMIAD